jgi:hypothetical protein
VEQNQRLALQMHCVRPTSSVWSARYACPQCSVSTSSLYPAVPAHSVVSTGSLYPSMPAHSVLCAQAACILLWLPTVFCGHRQPVSCYACPQAACILLCLPIVFCVHRQPISCYACPQCSVSTGSLYPAHCQAHCCHSAGIKVDPYRDDVWKIGGSAA